MTFPTRLREWGQTPRIITTAAGPEASTQIGLWVVEVNKKKQFYEFTNKNTVIASPYGPPQGPTTYGTWLMQDKWLMITWESREVETWDLPLYEGYQSGIRRPNTEVFAHFRPPNAYLRSIE